MADTFKILAFSGSARRDSLNKKLLLVAIKAVQDLGAEVTLVDLNQYAMPIYHGDLEAESGLPENASKLIDLITRHHALLIASPEYNSMFTPLLKNTIDWCTRGEENPFAGRVAGIVSASPGPLGGVRSLQLLQQLLIKLGSHVVPVPTTLPHADKAFDGNGQLTEPRSLASVQKLATALVETTRKLNPAIRR